MHQFISRTLYGILVSTLIWVATPARGVVATTTVENINAVIPDNDLNGISSQLISGMTGTIADINVTLTISGGFNGDFYGYLLHNNSSAILLNRVGRSSSSSVGYPDAGFGADGSGNRFTFDDQAANDVHFYRAGAFTLNGSSQLTGVWQPDGRAISPLSPASSFDSASRLEMLSTFNGMDPNGTWTLFLSDVSSGGEGTLVNWGLTITAVPEPGAASILVLASGLCVVYMRSRFVRP